MGRTACTELQCLYSTAIPLLPLWAVRPVQSLSACTRVHFTFNSTPPMGRTACTEHQCLYSTAIPLLPLWAVRPVQSLSACTRVHFTFNSTPPMGRTACTEPQCLYNGPSYLNNFVVFAAFRCLTRNIRRTTKSGV